MEQPNIHHSKEMFYPHNIYGKQTNPPDNHDFWGCVVGWIVGGLLLTCLSVCVGCRTKEIVKEVPIVVERVSERHDTIHHVDSILWHDSIYHLVKGDTVVIERWHTRNRITHDTTRISIHDSIPIVTTTTITEIKEVNKIKWWQKMMIYIGVGAMLMLLLLFVKILLKRHLN